MSNNEFVFDINPGLPVKNASKSKEHPSPEKSVFNLHQLQLINKIIQSNLEQQQIDLQTTLQSEKQNEYQRGLNDGIQKAQKQYQSQVQNSLDALNNITSSLSAQYNKLKEEQEQDILAFIITLTRKIIDTELEINNQIVLNILKNALNLLNEREEIKILVNPQDWLIVKENINYLKLRIDLPPNIEIVNNNTITRGGCRIESKSGSIDADIDTQFEEIKRKLLKYAE